MIRIRLKELLEEKERSMYWLSNESGLPYVTLWRMGKSKQKRIDLDVLSRIVEVLDCGVEEILVYVSDTHQKPSRKKLS